MYDRLVDDACCKETEQLWALPVGSMRLVWMEACTTAAPAENGNEAATSPSNSSEKVPPPVPSP